MGKMDERGETCSSRAGEKGLAAAAAVRAAPPSDPLAALLSNLSPEGSALLAKPEVLQAVLAAYSPGASASGPSPTLVCLVCKKGVPFVRSDANLADFFTKPLKPRRFFELRDKIMNIKSPVMNITFPNAS